MVPSKAIAAGYQLEVFEGTNYYLCQPNGHCGGMSAERLDGRIEQLGWDESSLVMLMSGPAAGGWHIVDFKTHVVRGPLTEEGLRLAQATDPRLAAIRMRPVEQVFHK